MTPLTVDPQVLRCRRQIEDGTLATPDRLEVVCERISRALEAERQAQETLCRDLVKGLDWLGM